MNIETYEASNMRPRSSLSLLPFDGRNVARGEDQAGNWKLRGQFFYRLWHSVFDDGAAFAWRRASGWRRAGPCSHRRYVSLTVLWYLSALETRLKQSRNYAIFSPDPVGQPCHLQVQKRKKKASIITCPDFLKKEEDEVPGEFQTEASWKQGTAGLTGCLATS